MSGKADFWSRRKAAVLAEAEADTVALRQEQVEAERATLEEKSDAEILAELDLPDPENLKMGDDVSRFMAETVPDRLRTKALRRLWRLNPVLANVDGLVDYGEDFTDAACVVENLQTAYKVGKGMLAHVERLAAQAESSDDVPPHEEIVEIAEAPLELTAPAEAAEVQDREQSADIVVESVAEEDPEPSAAPAPRRMRFEFEG